MIASAWPSISLIVFLALFVGIVVYVFVVPNSVWKKDARIPLDDSKGALHDKDNRGD
jgi:hypothetical protein